MTNLLAFLTALILAFGITPVVALWLSTQKSLPAIPRARDVHTTPTPRFGGLIIAGIFWLSIVGLWLVNRELLHFTDQTFWGVDRNLLGLIIGTMIIVGLGLVDDWRGLKPGWKLVGQSLAAAMLPLFDLRIQWLANPLGGLNLELVPVVDGFLIIIWLVLMMNVLNFLDGLDGLAAGVSSIALLTLYLLALAPFVSQSALAVLLIPLLGATLGFLPWNWHPAKIFLGDSGSQLLGYLIGAAAIISGGKLATAALVLSLPILDAFWAIIRRLFAGRSPFAADKDHLHHRLLALGLSQPQVVAVLMTTAAVFGMIALSSRTAGKLQALIGAALLMAILLLILTFFEHRSKRSGK